MKHLIKEIGTGLYWNNTDGYGSKETATEFDNINGYRLPIGGEWTPVQKEGGFAELKEENRRAKMQIADLMEALKPFAEMTTQFSGIRVRQGGEIFQYNDKKLMVEDFEKALDLMYYLAQHQIK